jgi:hypothetical protein
MSKESRAAHKARQALIRQCKEKFETAMKNEADLTFTYEELRCVLSAPMIMGLERKNLIWAA